MDTSLLPILCREAVYTLAQKKMPASGLAVCQFPQCLYIAALDELNSLRDLLKRPIPPLQFYQCVNGFRGKSPPDRLCWNAAYNGVGWNIFCDHGAGADHCAVADGDAR